MISRYTLPEMAAVWGDEAKLARWHEVEALVAEAWEQLGRAPAGAGDAIRAVPPIDPEAWRDRERVTNHDVAAFVDLLGAGAGDAAEWVHYGLTSSDVLDTSLGAAMVAATDLLLDRVVALFDVVKRIALEERDTAMVGRTHGIWAEPTTFGLKLAGWAFEIARDHRRLRTARATVAVGKVSGAVGTYAHVPPQVERYVCDRLGLRPEPASTQVTARDRHAEFLSTLALVGAGLERYATEIRHLQRSEVAEAREPFRAGQKGSSAMPHKRNPIGSENITGLARLLRSHAQVGLENVALWHERDISHSSAERVVIPDACLVLDFALHRLTRLIDGLVIERDRMQANLDATHGLVYSQAVLLALVDTGLSRADAYAVVQRNALAAWDAGTPLHDRLAADPDVTLDAGTLAGCFDPDHFLRRTVVVFDRLEKLEL